MRTLIIALAFLGLNVCVAQSGEHPAQLLYQFSEKKLDKMRSDNPDQYAYELFFVEHSFFVSEINPAKSMSFDGEITIKNLNEINIYKLSKYRDSVRTQYYKIKGTNQMICIRSEAEVAKIHEMYKKNQIKK